LTVEECPLNEDGFWDCEPGFVCTEVVAVPVSVKTVVLGQGLSPPTLPEENPRLTQLLTALAGRVVSVVVARVVPAHIAVSNAAKLENRKFMYNFIFVML
jgi:hypothetical protein